MSTGSKPSQIANVDFDCTASSISLLKFLLTSTLMVRFHLLYSGGEVVSSSREGRWYLSRVYDIGKYLDSWSALLCSKEEGSELKLTTVK